LQRIIARALAIGLLVVGLIAVPRISTVVAAGNLYISPVEVTPQPVGSNFTIQVKVASIDQFNGWTVQVVYDQSVINATSLSVTGNILVTNTTGGLSFELVNCINGRGTGCCLTNACYPLDGPGIADSSFSDTKKVSGSGLLFDVTFQVVSTKLYSPLTIENDLISNGTRTGVVHTTASGSYGSAPDFTVSASPPSLATTLGSSNHTTITLTSLHNFVGTVQLTSTLSSGGISATLTPTQVSLSAGGTASSQLIVQARNNASATSYTVTVTATSSSLPPNALPHTVQVTLQVHTKPDFEVFATPSLLLTPQFTSNSTTIIIASVNNFMGTVSLQVTGPSSTSYGLDKTSVTVPGGGSANATLHITTQASATRFQDYFYVNASSGSLFHVATVVAQPPVGDFSLSANPSVVNVQAGSTEVVTIGVTSLDYFVGTIYVLGTSQSGLALTFDPGSFYLNISQTVFSKLTVSTDPSTSPGNHTIILTVVGQLGAAALPTQHSMKLTFTISTSARPASEVRTFLGLQETEFFALIGGLAVALAASGVLEARRSRTKSRPILEG
jgi:hypothetical protein